MTGCQRKCYGCFIENVFEELIIVANYYLVHNVAQVIHCDIKPDNILVNSDGQVKISDFGISTMIENKNEKLKKIGGTKLFLPPETWKGRLLLYR